MDKNVFYVTLPSNASQLVYPNNKIWSYRTKLAKTLIINEPHEVGLIEIQYRKVWSSFPTSDASISVFDGKTMGEKTVVMTENLYNGKCLRACVPVRIRENVSIYITTPDT